MASSRRLGFVKARGNPTSAFQWRRRSQASFDDVLTGYLRNDNLGWYKEATDPAAQQNATETLKAEGIDHYDWQYHTGSGGNTRKKAASEDSTTTSPKITGYDWYYHDPDEVPCSITQTDAIVEEPISV